MLPVPSESLILVFESDQAVKMGLVKVGGAVAKQRGDAYTCY